jgi:hypothetical protein
MIRVRAFTILGLVTALALAALPADGAQRGGRRGGRGAQPAQAAPPPDTGRHAVPRGAPGGGPPGSPADQPGRGVVVAAPPAGVQHDGRWPSGYRSPEYRPYPGPVYGSYRQPVSGPYRGPVYGAYRGRIYAPPYRYAHPYYAFRPRVSIGVGFWAGFAVPFPRFAYGGVYPYPGYSYPGAYGYASPYPVPYPVPYPAPSPYPAPGYPGAGSPAQTPPPAGITAVPGTPAYGGVSIEVMPRDAEVWVDGGYAGPAEDFGPQARPLTLTAGGHRIELRAPGYLPLGFDVTITPGYVVPYQGTLQPEP